MVKNLPAVQETLGSIPGFTRFPWRRAWQPIPVFLPEESPRAEEPGRLHTVHVVTKSWTQLNN